MAKLNTLMTTVVKMNMNMNASFAAAKNDRESSISIMRASFGDINTRLDGHNAAIAGLESKLNEVQKGASGAPDQLRSATL